MFAKDMRNEIAEELRRELTPIVKAELTVTLRPKIARELTILLEPKIRKDLHKRVQEEYMDPDYDAEEDEEEEEEEEEEVEEEHIKSSPLLLSTKKEASPAVVTEVNMNLIASMSFEERQAFFSNK